jgi:hypothetical protein
MKSMYRVVMIFRIVSEGTVGAGLWGMSFPKKPEARV